jgi:hypothetical protein
LKTARLSNNAVRQERSPTVDFYPVFYDNNPTENRAPHNPIMQPFCGMRDERFRSPKIDSMDRGSLN